MGAAWGVAYRFSRALLWQKGASLDGFRGLFLGLFISSWVGAKLFFLGLLALTPPHVGTAAQMAQNPSFWMGGGMVFYGGLGGGMAFAAAYSLGLRRFPPERLFCLLPGLAFGHAIGRVGCWLAGCCYGRPTSWPLGVVLDGVSRHPVQLYEAAALSGLGVFLWHKIRRKDWPGQWIWPTYLLSYSVMRFLLEFFRGDRQRGVWQSWAGEMSTSQGVGLAVVLGVVLWWLISHFVINKQH